MPAEQQPGNWSARAPDWFRQPASPLRSWPLSWSSAATRKRLNGWEQAESATPRRAWGASRRFIVLTPSSRESRGEPPSSETEMTKRALITGITGQDGSYLAELLLSKGYEVHGLIRRSSSFSTDRIDHLYRDPHNRDVPLYLYYGDLSDSSSLINNLNRIKPDEVYNLGAQSHVKVSFEMPEFTADTAGMGNLRLLEAIRHADWPVRFYQAGSSEMYGQVTESPQTETTPFYPRSPHAGSKLLAHSMTV